MKLSRFRLALLGYAVLCCVTTGHAASLSAAGSTFAEPLYKQWGQQYGDFRYEGSGSGAGVAGAQAHTVDFGASDEPLPRAELESRGLRQYPVAMGAIVPVVNLPGVPAGELHLSPELIARIYLGQITRWNDGQIADLNEALRGKLPNLPIRPIARTDSSGSTFAFTYYLNARSAGWKQARGVSKDLVAAGGLGAKGSGGVVALVRQTVGALAYVDYGRALREQLNMAQLPNRYGVFVRVGPDSILAAAKFDTEKLLYTADPDFYLVLADNDTYAGWPLTTATFAMLPRSGGNVRAVLAFLYAGFKQGDLAARELGYVPLSDSMKIAVRKAWSRQYGFRGGL